MSVTIDRMVSNPSLAGRAQTVLGPVPAESLGVTLPHEHLLWRHPMVRDKVGEKGIFFVEPQESSERALAYQKVQLENRWWVAYNPQRSLDNLGLEDPELAIREVSHFKQAGGQTIVEMTTRYISRDPMALARISRATGINIIMGTGYYTASSHPPGMADKTEQEICDEIVREVQVGVDRTGIRAGMIGEIGCSYPLQADEQKVLRAAARAQQVTGAPLNIHPGRHPDAPFEIIDILSKAGADIHRTAMSHVDRTIRDLPTLRQLAATGCYVEYDLFGIEGYFTIPTIDFPNDNRRIDDLMQLIADGLLNQLLVSQDICWKIRLRHHGGHGYDHLLRNTVPMMRAKGMSEEQISALLVDNARRLLQFV